MPTFDIIMTTWNRLDYTKRTVASLLQSGAWDKCERFIIVDNGSREEGMQEFLNVVAGYTKTWLIRRPKNDGWATSVNDAIGCSRADYILLINNDVEFDIGFIEKMFEAIKNPSVVSSMDGIPQIIGILGGWHHTSHSFTGVGNSYFKEMDNVPAVCWLIPKSAMEKVGMLQEKGVCMEKGGNGEDTDYVNKMKTAGLLTGVTALDVAHHIDGY